MGGGWGGGVGGGVGTGCEYEVVRVRCVSGKSVEINCIDERINICFLLVTHPTWVGHLA